MTWHALGDLSPEPIDSPRAIPLADLEARQRAAGIPERFRAVSFDVVAPLDRKANGGQQSEAFDLAACWKPSDGSLWLAGPQGRGKSTLACCVAREMLSGPESEEEVPHTVDYLRRRLGCSEEVAWRYLVTARKGGRAFSIRAVRRPSILYVEGAELDEQWASYSAYRFADMQVRDPVTAACNVQILIWDDFGVLKRTPKSLSLISLIIRQRYNTRKPPIYTSNEQVRDLYGSPETGPLISRIVESVGRNHARMDGRDHRIRR